MLFFFLSHFCFFLPQNQRKSAIKVALQLNGNFFSTLFHLFPPLLSISSFFLLVGNPRFRLREGFGEKKPTLRRLNSNNNNDSFDDGEAENNNNDDDVDIRSGYARLEVNTRGRKSLNGGFGKINSKQALE